MEILFRHFGLQLMRLRRIEKLRNSIREQIYLDFLMIAGQ